MLDENRSVLPPSELLRNLIRLGVLRFVESRLFSRNYLET